jgi:hypothetical protein
MQTRIGMITAMGYARALGEPAPWSSKKFQMNQDCAIAGYGFSVLANI